MAKVVYVVTYMRPDRLRQRRETKGFSQQDIADRVGISLSQYRRYERGDIEPPVDNAVRIAKELEVSLEYLVGLVDDPSARLTESNLSDDEKRLLQAWRDGHVQEMLYLIATNEEIAVKMRRSPEIAVVSDSTHQ